MEKLTIVKIVEEINKNRAFQQELAISLKRVDEYLSEMEKRLIKTLKAEKIPKIFRRIKPFELEQQNRDTISLCFLKRDDSGREYPIYNDKCPKSGNDPLWPELLKTCGFLKNGEWAFLLREENLDTHYFVFDGQKWVVISKEEEIYNDPEF